MNINNIAKFITGMNLFATGSIVGLTTKLLVDTFKEKYETQDKDGEVDENVQISAEDFAAMQNELEELKLELAELKGAEETTEAESLQPSVESENLTVGIPDDIAVPAQNTQTPAITTEPNIESQPANETNAENVDNHLKEIDITNLTQNEANEIWTSYLKGNCEYDLNKNNIEEFCLKFGFDSSLAR